jgi:hypothetical protein
MAVDLRCKMKLPIEEVRIGIDQDLLRIEAPTFLRSPRSVDSITVALADFDSGEVAVPDRSLTMGERKTDFLPLLVHQDHIDGIGCRCPESEVDTA